ncbi:MAG: extracellular solute-binding protein [Treponema sp.]|nr:extracellular solute-binding protein [Treponema sp.]
MIQKTDIVLIGFAVLIIGMALTVWVQSSTSEQPGMVARNTGSTATTPPTSSQVELSFSHYFDPLAVESLISLFEQQYPDINVTSIPREVYEPVPAYADITACDSRYSSKQDAHTTDHSRIATHGYVFFYRIDHLEQAGLYRPPKTYLELLRAVRAIGPQSFSIGSDYYADIYSWLWAAGIRLITNGRFNIDSKKVIEILLFIKSLSEHLASDPFKKTESQKVEEFIAGTTSMIIAPSYNVSVIQEYLQDSLFGVTTIPIPDDYRGKAAFAAFSHDIAFVQNSEQKTEASLFIEFLIDHKNMLLPAENKHDPLMAKIISMFEIGELVTELQGFSSSFGLSMQEELVKFLEESQSAEETVQAISHRWNNTGLR